MRRSPLLHPSARLVGAAPRHDGLWVSLWVTAHAVVCVTVGMAPGDASTAKRSIRLPDLETARLAARRRLSALWDSYLADRAGRGRRFGAPPRAGFGFEAPAVGAPVDEGPVAADAGRPALRRCVAPAAG
jgi:hypothetical protein